ncbi:MAG TPA: FxLYD domain-containing protein [Polyangiaceae bacterium]|nr:FxLYD domain-containing protein [Polyangiaceae bacterium]
MSNQLTLSLAFAFLLIACSSNGDDPAGTEAKGGNSSVAGSSGIIVGDGKPFFPDDIKYEIVDGGRALTLIAATLIEDPTDGEFWVIAVRNDETVPICMPQVNAAFSLSTDPEDNGSGQAVVRVQGAMYQSDGSPAPCLAPGDTGMGAQFVSRTDQGTARIRAVAYQGRGYQSPEAAKLPALAVEQVKIVSSAMGNVVTGNVTNRGTTSVAMPEVTLFSVDSGGRPTDFGYASSQTDLAVGSSWSFQATIPSQVNRSVAFAVYGQQ